ncbi:DUF6480 family protein [Streptomyces sp. DSM 42041]|uniref:DUF6480 family protein n=1 Tax=Streptomyces hazeniae TaxID=3075538 RepID=A0ABU2NN70_9ACTN|nr:DUF6480 family protein [Streptomyces sp. DSM 42041]MDT0378199.1 DUF6480 family protein [Streptomyces sp. DSM 42041]
MSHSDGSESADPDPENTPGLSPGGEMRQGDTPPAEGGTLDTGPRETYNPTRGWAAAPLVVIAVFCLLVAGFFIARLVLAL